MSLLRKLYRLARQAASSGQPKTARPLPAAVNRPLRQPVEAEASTVPLDYLVSEGLDPGVRERVLIFADGPGATYVISFVQPLRHLASSRQMGFAAIDEAAFAGLAPRAAAARVARAFDEIAPTVVVASRFGGQGSAAIVDQCRRREIRLIAHLDDNLFAVPPNLGKAKFEKYNDPARLGRMRLLCERASIVYASTPDLARQLSATGLGTKIVAGEIYCSIAASVSAFRPRIPPVFGYMGTSGHADDLEMIVPAIRSVLHAMPDVSFQTFGSIKMPAALEKEFASRVSSIAPTKDYASFLDRLSQLGWSCGLAPLVETPFNACKAETKFVEYTAAGIPTVASSVPTYRAVMPNSELCVAESQEDWSRLIGTMLSSPETAEGLVVAAQNKLRQTHSIDILALQVAKILSLEA